ncbi:MAG: PAS domain S-box protein [Deltaproteobacteria bacterium]|nr:MAG: PAS domain S-box protein [Deltaproteobacteria bacterium]
MRISRKLSLGFVTVATLVALMGIAALRAGRQITETFAGDDDRFRRIVSAAMEVGHFDKDAETHLLLYLALNDPVDRKKYQEKLLGLARNIAILDSRVRIPEARRILEDIRSEATALRATGDALLALRDQSVDEGRFVPERHGDRILALDRAAASLREASLRLADFETDFLNRQAAITAGTHAGSYTKRAESHLMMYLVLHNPSDRRKFYERHSSLLEELAVLNERVKDEEGKTILADIESGAVRLLSSGNALLLARDAEMARAGKVDPAGQEERIREFHRVAHEAQESTVRMVGHMVNAEKGLRDVTYRKAADVEREVFVFMGVSVALALSFGLLFSRSLSVPIRRLGEVAQRIGSGDLDATAGPRRPDELGELAATFDRMAGKLRRTMVSRDYLDSILRSMSDALVAVDLSGNIKTVNRALLEMLGYREEELAGRPMAEILGKNARVPGSGRERWNESGVVRDAECVFVGRDGEEIPVRLTGASIRGPDGAMGGAVYTAVDLRERKRKEQEAKQQQAKLIHSSRMAALGSVVSGVAHEVSNPNNVVMFNAPLILSAWRDAAELLERQLRERGDFPVGGLPYSEMREAVPRMIQGISEASARIRNIVATLKDYTRQENDHPGSRFQVNDAVRSTVQILNHEILKSTHDFRVAYGEGLPPVEGSVAELEQVILNLILNALQALHDPGRGIRVSTSFREETGHVVIAVADEGSGMPPEILERITEPFFSTKLESGGLGLGLSISRDILEKHGGTLTFRSDVGHGTEAWASLPAAKPEATSVPGKVSL